jgi:hypothetical protein
LFFFCESTGITGNRAATFQVSYPISVYSSPHPPDFSIFSTSVVGDFILQLAQGTLTNKIRESKEDRLKGDYKVGADLNFKWEQQRKNENGAMACRSIKY